MPIGLLKIEILGCLYNHYQITAGCLLTPEAMVLDDWCKEHGVVMPRFPSDFPIEGSTADYWDVFLGKQAGHTLSPIAAAKMLTLLNNWLPPTP